MGGDYPSSAWNNVNKGHAFVLNYRCGVLTVDCVPAPPQVPSHDPTCQYMSSQTIHPGGPRASHSLSSEARKVLEQPQVPEVRTHFPWETRRTLGQVQEAIQFQALPSWKTHRKSSSSPRQPWEFRPILGQIILRKQAEPGSILSHPNLMCHSLTE